MPFEVTPFILYLTREVNTSSSAMPRAVAADSKSVADTAPQMAPQMAPQPARQ